VGVGGLRGGNFVKSGAAEEKMKLKKKKKRSGILKKVDGNEFTV
jgi:hypothetical protein